MQSIAIVYIYSYITTSTTITLLLTPLAIIIRKIMKIMKIIIITHNKNATHYSTITDRTPPTTILSTTNNHNINT